MNKGFMLLALGLGLGILLGYNNEEEISDICYKSKRAKKNMMRKMQSMQDNLD